MHFAAHKNHIGFCPQPSAISALNRQLAGYKTAKGSIQVPLDRPLPAELIIEIGKFRIAENTATTENKKKRSSK